jgi:hypothetical protein
MVEDRPQQGRGLKIGNNKKGHKKERKRLSSEASALCRKIAE